MIFDTRKVGEIETNCYILSAEPPDAMIIDPGGDAAEILMHLEAKRLEPILLVNTHGHADHIAANAELRARFDGMKIAIGRPDSVALSSAARNMSFLLGRRIESPSADRLLDDGDLVELGKWQFRVLATPGHSPGGISLFIEDLDGRPALFCGDTLFAGSVGRCDIPGGDWQELERSIREKIFILPAETVVYPGHGPSTTVAEEKQLNPFVGDGAGTL